MMKHENPSKPILIGSNHNNGTLHVASPNSGKRSIWRTRSSSEAPASAPKSPITKAFDFLPWSRSKKSVAEKAATASHINTNGHKDANAVVNTVDSRDTSEEYKKDCINYHRNIFRNGGGIIRDILGDKLNKERQQVLPSEALSNNTLPNPHSGKYHQRRPKQVVARNKSLDINELIDCVENELAADKKNFSRSRFLDDTFIENIIRAKNEYQRNSRLQGDLVEDDYVYGNNYYGDELVHYDESGEKRKENNNNNTSTPSKHILFNDENVVYLIKKELPVKREMSKTKAAIEHNSRANQQKTTNGEKERKHERSTSVLRARLKFKKVTPPETAPLSEHHSQVWNNQQKHPQHQQSASQRSNYLHSKSVIDNCAIIGMASVGLSLMNPAGASFKQSNGLQRQNTSPAAPPSHHGTVNVNANDSSEPHHGRHHQLYQRSEQHSQRRKSLTDTNYGPSACFDNSSSSSMGSGGGGVGGGGIISERPKTEKPRKKLSFREPVVSEKGRSRRISSPAQKSPVSPESTVNSVVATDSNSNASGAHTTMKGNCDNSNLLLDNRFARSAAESAAADQTAVDAESQAMRIVRTVGQAFEVCHKFNLHKNSLDNNDERSDASSDLLDVDHISEHQLSDDDVAKKDHNAVTPDLNPPQRPNHLELVPQTNLNIRKSPCVLTDDEKSPTTPSSPNREIHKLKDQLEQQALQTRQALAQLMLVREQLISETNARIEAQARTQQLLQQNRELLEHLASLGAYTEQQTSGLTTANIAMAPQSQLQMLLQATSNNNNLATINQQINNLGSINQQLTSLSHQLSGLNQQSQNLQNLQNINANLHQHQHQQQQQQQQQHHQQPTLTPPTPSTSRNPSQLHLNVSAANVTSSTGTLSTSPFPSMNQLQNISAQLQNMSVQSSQQQQDALSKDLFKVNQELLNRLQVLNLGTGHAAATNATLALNGSPLPTTQQTPSPNSSFFFVNPMSCSPSNNNSSANNFNFLSSPSGLSAGNLTPSPMGTLNRSSFSNSPINDELGLSIDKNLNSLDEHGLMKPMGQMSAAASNGNIASGSATTTRDNSRSSSTVESPSSPSTRNGNEARFNTVMLKVTDEAGNVTNQRKLSATPSFITRSTSEKVPNRSQMMSQVQRTAWARHTTK